MENKSIIESESLSDELIIESSSTSNSSKETRQIVTPYAFHVSPELFGTPLASPFKRALAIGIDGMLLWMLTQASGFFLAGVAAATFFRAGNRLKQKKRFNGVRITLRFLTAILLFVFVMGIVDEINYGTDGNAQSSNEFSAVEGIASIGLTGKYIFQINNTQQRIDDEKCLNPEDCWGKLAEELTSDLVKLEMEHEKATGIMDVVVEMQSEIYPNTKAELLKPKLMELYELKSKQQSTTKNSQEVNLSTPNSQSAEIHIGTDKPNSTSIVDWIKGTLDDLGLGFGWAAFYFSVSTAWWKGQTPGKKFVGIKVLKLDNSELNLWESFGRYGGYGAGFATGLMGFLQVFWDPNRRAIQDKISETLVIDIRKEKQTYPPK
ncbi:RDD family protein [Paraglaciecola sp.]|uniref:RDD family protein n=1 Tax=Paraglaciecola sp. TaxID=1920173 RepID=UPI003EFB1149